MDNNVSKCFDDMIISSDGESGIEALFSHEFEALCNFGLGILFFVLFVVGFLIFRYKAVLSPSLMRLKNEI